MDSTEKTMKDKDKSLLRMFLTFLKVGTFTIGGGYAMLPILQREFVDKLGWMDEEEFLDGIALAQSAPGAMAVNLSVYVGFRLFRIKGALLGLLGAVLPSLVIMVIIAYAYTLVRERFSVFESIFRGIGPMVTGIVFAAAVGMLGNVRQGIVPFLLMAATLLLVGWLGLSPIWVILGGGLIGAIFMRGEVDKDAR